MRLELFGTADAARMAQAHAIRVAVFVDEQGCPLDEEFDEHDDPADPQAVHALVRHDDGTVIATGRYYHAPEQTAQIGRMAVTVGGRGRGAGRMMLDALTNEARARGSKRRNTCSIS